MLKSQWDFIIGLLQSKTLLQARKEAECVLAQDPLDPEALLISAAIARELGDDDEAVSRLWAALMIEPALPVLRNTLLSIFIQECTTPPVTRDFSLQSGERQTSANLAGIRVDHRCRYEFAASWVRDNIAGAASKTGVDLFSGNGYGSAIMAHGAGCRMIGVDGSADAVALAEQAYGTHRVLFKNAYFPFGLLANKFDFAVCYESIEHVAEPDKFLAVVDAATQGPIFLSFPLEDTLPFAVNADLFKYHTQHFTVADMENRLMTLCGRRITQAYGQVVYQTTQSRLDGYIPEEDMILTDLNATSQFAIVVAEKI